MKAWRWTTSMKVWVVVCTLWVQLKIFISFCLEFCLVLAVIGLFCNVKYSFLKMRGGLRRVSLEVWTLARKQGREGLIEKENPFDPSLTLCVWVPRASPSAASSRTSFSLFKEPCTEGGQDMLKIFTETLNTVQFLCYYQPQLYSLWYLPGTERIPTPCLRIW